MDALAKNAHWLLRISLASVFLYHGLPKWGDLGGMAQMTGMPVFAIAMVAFAETAGGLGILVGGFTKSMITRLAGLAVIPVMLGAIFKMHWGQWSFLPSETHPMGGIEFQVVLLMIAVYFVLTGNGDEAASA